MALRESLGDLSPLIYLHSAGTNQVLIYSSHTIPCEYGLLASRNDTGCSGFAALPDFWATKYPPTRRWDY